MSQRLASTYGTVMATVRSFLVLYSTYSIYMRTTCRFPLLGGFEKKKKTSEARIFAKLYFVERHRHKQNRLPWRDSTVEIPDGPLPLSYSQQRQ